MPPNATTSGHGPTTIFPFTATTNTRQWLPLWPVLAP
jgi:hypothetical protein